MNALSWIVLALIIFLAALAIRSMLKRKKSHSSCGCGCNACSFSKNCTSVQKQEDVSQ